MPPKASGKFPTTPSNTKMAKSSTNAPAAQNFIRQRLAQHNMYQGDDDSFDKYPEFQTLVREIVKGTRHSEPRPDSEKKFKLVRKLFRTSNESTLMNNIIPMFIKDSRDIPLESTTTGGPATGASQAEPFSAVAASYPEQTWVVKDYLDSNCIRLTNVDFSRAGDFLPIDEDLAKAMSKDSDKEEGMTNPKPDFVYGLSSELLAPPKNVKISADTQRIREIVPLMFDCMFLIEGKSDSGEAAHSENQACRGGAALVNAARQLRDRIGDLDVEGADTRTFVFSGTMSPDTFQIWVHWADVSWVEADTGDEKGGNQDQEMGNPDQDMGSQGQKAGENKGSQKGGNVKKTLKKHVDYHMNLLESQHLASNDTLKNLRMYCQNILDWGCITKYNKELKPLYERIYAWEKKQQTQTPQAQSTPSKSLGSTPTGSKRQKTG
ncbi:MAG: hypothetical protein Q9191_003622 [Dirinaria sp. TL-2023a]